MKNPSNKSMSRILTRTQGGASGSKCRQQFIPMGTREVMTCAEKPCTDLQGRYLGTIPAKFQTVPVYRLIVHAK